MRRLIRRAVRLGPAELWHRSRERLRSGREALGVAIGRDRWRRDILAGLLGAAGEPALRDAHRALRARDWAAADDLLRLHFAARSPGFPIGPAVRSRLVASVIDRHPDAPADAARRADRLLRHRYDLLGYRDLDYSAAGAAIDWHTDPVHGRQAPRRFWTRVPYLDPRCGDHKIIWELNRHQHWLALGRAAWLTGDTAYAGGFEKELTAWLGANPPLVGINWASMLELAFRSISWIWALHFFAGARRVPEFPWSVDLLTGLARQLEHVRHHLSTFFSPNTHLLGEGLALYVGGRALPELRPAAAWERAGRDILLRQSTAQVLPDGAHAELSTHYHRYALDFYLLALVVARRTGDPAESMFADTVSRLAVFCRALADDRGRLPLIGDDDGGMLFPICGRSPHDAGDSLALAAALLGRPDLSPGGLPEETIWMLGGEIPETGAPGAGAAPPSRLFPEAGYAVLRSRASHAVFDAGRHGFLNGGHAHADALSLVLSIDGRRVLIDPGTATYTMDSRRRDLFRSTRMHNTLTLDGREPSVPRGPFHWTSRADARVEMWRAGNGFDCVEGSHDGYAPVTHRRSVLRIGEAIWLVADHVLGTGAHEAVLFWHLSPEWLPGDSGASTAALAHGDGSRAALACTSGIRDILHADDTGLGWWAPVYGRLEPAPTIRCVSIAEAPFSIVSALAAGAPAAGLSIRALEIVPISRARDGWHRTAARLEWNTGSALALFSTPCAGSASGRQPVRIAARQGTFETDARVAYLELSKDGAPARLVCLEAGIARWTGPDGFEVTPGPGERDLHRDHRAFEQLSRAAAARPAG